MHPRLAELTEYLDGTRAALEERVAALPPDARTRRPAPDAWSPAEIVDHLSRVEGRIVQALARMVAQAADAGLGPEESSESVMGRLDRYAVASGLPRRQASEASRPASDADAERALAALRGTRAELHRLLRAVDGLALDRLTAPHPVVGELDFYGWVLFLGQHEERHLRQLIAATRRDQAASS